MSATLELKYFNTFWLKKINSITTAVSVTDAAAIKPTFNDPTMPENLPLSFSYKASDDQIYSYTVTGNADSDWMIEEQLPGLPIISTIKIGSCLLSCSHRWQDNIEYKIMFTDLSFFK